MALDLDLVESTVLVGSHYKLLQPAGPWTMVQDVPRPVDLCSEVPEFQCLRPTIDCI